MTRIEPGTPIVVTITGRAGFTTVGMLGVRYGSRWDEKIAHVDLSDFAVRVEVVESDPAE